MRQREKGVWQLAVNCHTRSLSEIRKTDSDTEAIRWIVLQGYTIQPPPRPPVNGAKPRSFLDTHLPEAEAEESVPSTSFLDQILMLTTILQYYDVTWCK